MASASLWPFPAEVFIFIFANQQSLRALLVCFFTGKVVTVHCIFCGDYAFYLWDSFCEKMVWKRPQSFPNHNIK